MNYSSTSRFLLPPLPFPQEIRAWDAGAEALGLPEMLLMENAAREAFDVLRRHCPDIAGCVFRHLLRHYPAKNSCKILGYEYCFISEFTEPVILYPHFPDC